MNPERWQQIERLYRSALERDPADREAYLREVCGNDEALLREGAGLLSHEAEAEDFLESAAIEMAAEQASTGQPAEHAGEFQMPPGVRVGNYEILQAIGQGGMAKVYSARDMRLGRTVAVKVLTCEGIDPSEIRRRFEREARAISSLNHPNICTIHDIGEQDGQVFLVMEYLEGRTLKQHMGRHPLPLPMLIEVTIQISDGLAAAHAKGIIHRDIKPANLFLSPRGQSLSVKILDFGLAKLASNRTTVGEDPGVLEPPAEMSATNLTNPGTAIGTVAYMSPEQARGEPLDSRTDLFSLGAVLYEMATGCKPFRGETSAAIFGAILHEAPTPPQQFNPKLPFSLEAIIYKALEKDRELRYQSAGDLGSDLKRLKRDWHSSRERVAEEGEPTRKTLLATIKRRTAAMWTALSGKALSWTLASALLVLGVAWIKFTRTNHPAAVARLSFQTPYKINLDVRLYGTQVAVSPDGSTVAFVGTTHDGNLALWLRSINSYTAREIPGTEGAGSPFWSPDGTYLAFVSSIDREIKRIDLSQDQWPIRTIWRGSVGPAGAWSTTGEIVFLPKGSGSGLYAIPAGGGTARTVTTLSHSRQEISHRYPQFLPDGRHFLYWVWSALEEYTGIYVGSLEPDATLAGRGPLLQTWRMATYAAGHLLFLQGSTLMAQRFDPDRFRVTGEPRVLPEQIGSGMVTGQANFSVASSSVLAYHEAMSPQVSKLDFVDRRGKRLREVEVPSGATNPSLSPDEERVVICAQNKRISVEEIWVVDLNHGSSARITYAPSSSQGPVWSADGRWVAYFSNLNGIYDLYARDVIGGQGAKLLVKSENQKFPTDWSWDSRFLAYAELNPQTKWDLWILPLAGDGVPFTLLKTDFNELNATFAPVPERGGMRWMAHECDETGHPEVYLRRFSLETPGAEAGAKWQVSKTGGTNPRWRKDGRGLFYMANNALMAVDVTLGRTAQIGSETRLFSLPEDFSGYNYLPMADGQRFLLIPPPVGSNPATINVVLNWTSDLGHK